MLEAIVKKESWYLLRGPDKSSHVEGIQRERERDWKVSLSGTESEPHQPVGFGTYHLLPNAAVTSVLSSNLYSSPFESLVTNYQRDLSGHVNPVLKTYQWQPIFHRIYPTFKYAKVIPNLAISFVSNLKCSSLPDFLSLLLRWTIQSLHVNMIKSSQE